jgi:hypothetical protein
MIGTIIFISTLGLSALFLLFVLFNFWMESRVKNNGQERLLHAVTADKWLRYNSGRPGW